MEDRNISVFSAKLHKFTFENSHNPLLLGINNVDKLKFFPNVSENFFILGLTQSADRLSRDATGPCLCSGVLLVNSDPPESEPDLDTQLSLLCSQQYLDQYGFHYDDTVQVKKLNPPNLTKVTFEALTERAFQWATSHFFTTGLLVNVCNQHGVLVRRNASFLTPHSSLFENDPNFTCSIFEELMVVDTEPFLQGTVTVKTEFVVLKASETLATNLQKKNVTNKSRSKIPNAVHVSDFAVPQTSLFVPRQINKPTFNTRNPQSITLERDWSFLPCENFSQLPDFYHKSSWDIDHTVWVSLNTAKRFNLFNGNIVQIQKELKQKATPTNIPSANSLEDDKKSKDDRKLRVVEVRILPPAPKIPEYCHRTDEPRDVDGRLFMSSALWFNLNSRYNTRPMEEVLIKLRKHQSTCREPSSVSVSCEDSVPAAREVSVACVCSPRYNTGAIYNTALARYFTTPRLLMPGDIFAVDTSVDPEYSQSTEDSSSPLAFFRVTKMLPKLSPRRQTYRVHTDTAALYQDGSCHSDVPAVLAHTSPDGPLQTVAPPGLAESVREIVNIVTPYLHKWSSTPDSRPSLLLHGPAGCGKSRVSRAVAATLGLHHLQINCHDLCGDTSSATEARIQQNVQRACLCSPCVLMLHNIHALGKDRDGNTEDPRVAAYFHQCLQQTLHKDSPDWPVVVIATTSTPKQLTADMNAGFLHTVEMEVPDESRRHEILAALMADVPRSVSVSAKRIAQRTAGFVLGDLEMLMCQAKKTAYKQIIKHSVPGAPTPDDLLTLTLCGPVLQQTHFDQALDHIQATHSDAIGAPKIPSVTWHDVGGLAQVKADILDTIQLPLQHPELFAAGLRRSGVLLYGPPGTGKTLLAKAVATECSLNFLSVKGPELINMYVGQSEENVREVFSRARNATPCVIFFDELDSLAPNRGRSGDSGGVMDRVVSQLLAELDGLHKSCDVFVIGATNRPDLLDPALLRPGRFDKMLYLGVSEDRDSQLKILKALTRKFKLAASCILEDVVVRCPYHLTGADFYALGSDAMLNALKRSIDTLEAGSLREECGEVSPDGVEVTQDDFLSAVDNLVPSVSETELQHYKTLQAVLAQSK